MEDPLFKGNQNFLFEMDLDELDERMFGDEANAGVSFQIGQLRYVLFHDEYIPVRTKYIPGTYWILTCISCCRAWHDAQSQEKRYPGTDRHVAEGAQAAAASCRTCPPGGDGEQVCQ